MTLCRTKLLLIVENWVFIIKLSRPDLAIVIMKWQFYFIKKTFEIGQKAFYSSYYHLVSYHNNVSNMYYNTAEYSTALSFYKCTGPSKYPNLQTYRKNFDLVKKNCRQLFIKEENKINEYFRIENVSCLQRTRARI